MKYFDYWFCYANYLEMMEENLATFQYIIFIKIIFAQFLHLYISLCRLFTFIL